MNPGLCTTSLLIWDNFKPLQDKWKMDYERTYRNEPRIMYYNTTYIYIYFCLFVYNNFALRQGYINSTANTGMYPLNYNNTTVV